MPRWDFSCKSCNTVIELSFKDHEASKRAKCPSCRRKVERLASAVSATFNGPGFYATDYKRNKNAS